jgi:16S rRNA G966 N2-methylase RsmD
VLDRIGQTLAHTAAAAREAAQAVTVEPETASLATWQQFAERLQQLDDCVKNAHQAGAAAEASLEDSETGLRLWLAEAEAIRARLAKRAAPAVS